MKRQPHSDLYSPLNEANLFMRQRRQQMEVRLLHQHGISNFELCQVLEVGCGTGSILADYLGYGVSGDALHGIDIRGELLIKAKHRIPHGHFICAAAQSIPYPTQYFDFVLQYTVFSSITDAVVRTKVAQEMLRVLKPNGVIVWYDFWVNPLNPDTEGIRPAEIRHLFPSCQYKFRRITLAPPLCRKLIPPCWGLATLLEYLKILNTHYLVIITAPR
ncbi:MAG: class I SAM-dependent methyltransferase [Chloroflexi bacterium]|nr:class I SAM-dependent methyltransferase [Chloroflexota bacterium]